MSATQDKIDKFIRHMIANKTFRLSVVEKSPLWFFYFYLKDYVKYEIAPFQKEMFTLVKDMTIEMCVIVSFRGSSKSTIMTTSYPLWAILGEQKKKFIVIISQTQQKAQQHLLNIKYELEKNERLRRDLGPFQEERSQWGSQALVLSNFNAKITIASVEQSTRGIRHQQHRPDLIIIDDIEDLDSVKTQEGRDKTFSWLTKEIIPMGEHGTKIVVVGNLLHEDSVIKRLQRKIEEDPQDRIYREYPIVDENGDPVWYGKFPDKQSIEHERRKVMNEFAWRQEYLLELVSEENPVVHREYIQHYDKLPEGYDYTAIGIDLAISEKQSADFTAMVSARVIGSGQNLKVYILPNAINRKADHPTNLETAETLARGLDSEQLATVFVEDVGYQKSFIQDLEIRIVPVVGVKTYSQDKRARLISVTHLLQSGQILFPTKGAEQLIQQLLKFGIEKHDDLVDAFTTLIRGVVEKNRNENGWLGYVRDDLQRRKENPLSSGNLAVWQHLANS